MLNYGSYLDRLVNTCAQIFSAALALYLAAELIKAVWLSLLLILLGVALLVGTVLLVRRRLRGW